MPYSTYCFIIYKLSHSYFILIQGEIENMNNLIIYKMMGSARKLWPQMDSNSDFFQNIQGRHSSNLIQSLPENVKWRNTAKIPKLDRWLSLSLWEGRLTRIMIFFIIQTRGHLRVKENAINNDIRMTSINWACTKQIRT